MSTTTKDFNRLSFETCEALLHALCAATDELQGSDTFENAVAHSELFCDLVPMQLMVNDNMRARDGLKYFKVKEMTSLLHLLYQRMQMYHHYGACKGRELPGIKWSEEANGRFVLSLNECAINLTHTICDERRPNSPEGKVFCIGFDPNIDCEESTSPLFEHYENALNFCCEFKDENGGVECRDITLLDRYPYRKMVRNILAGLDAIAEMNNEIYKLKNS